MAIHHSKRHPAIRIALYNHKGGVGKTTLTISIAEALSRLGKKILLVDSDPQSNLTSHLIDEDTLNAYLDNSDGSEGQTIWSALKPVVEGDGGTKAIKPFETTLGSHVYLIPGDIKLAEFESVLVNLWAEAYQRRIRGLKGISALSQYINECCHNLKIDYVFYDTGPNIGHLNKTILLDCDYFIVPAACDLFSKRAFKTLGVTIVSWIKDWELIQHFAPENIFALLGKPKFLGYIPQRFKTYGGQMSQDSASYLSIIQKAIFNDIIQLIRKQYPELISPKKGTSQYKLGEIKEYTTLVLASQLEGVSLSQTQGAPKYQREEAVASFDQIAQKIVALT